jgi:hypothetical protein
MEILTQLKAAGLHIILAGDYIKCGPKHLLTDDNRAIIREHKADIVQELRRDGPPYPNGQGLVKCFYCSHLQEGTTCKVSRTRVYGISLLIDCGHFAMKTLH